LAENAVLYVRLRPSRVLPEFTAAALDLLVEVERADRILVTDEILEAADRMRACVERWSGEL
jgi:hypothetical protein